MSIEHKKHEKRLNWLREKYRNKTYIEKNQIEYILSIAFSWFFNGLSALGAMAFATIFFLGFMAGKIVPAVIAAIALCVGWEILKRRALITAWEDYFIRDKVKATKVMYCAAIILGSIAATFFGTKEMIYQLNEDSSELVSFEDRSELIQNQLESKRAKLKSYQTDKKYQTSSGEILYNISQFTIPRIETSIDSLESKLIALQESTEKKNSNLTTLQKVYAENRSWQYAVGVALSDILIILLIGYKEKFEYYEALIKGVFGQSETLNRNDLKRAKQNASLNKRNASNNASFPVSRSSEAKRETLHEKTEAPVSIDASQRNASQKLDLKSVSDFASQKAFRLYLENMTKKKEGALRNAKSRLKKGEGNKETNQKAVNRYRAHLKQIDAAREALKS